MYKIDEDVLEPEKFNKIITTLSTDSRNRINTGSRPLIIESQGLRTDINGVNFATNATERRLNKYEFGAERIPGIRVDLKTGFSIEIGDIVNVNMSDLQLSDKNTGTRAGENRLFQIDNKTFDMRTGRVILDIVDTNFTSEARYGLISPASFIKSGTSQTVFTLEPSFNTDDTGQNEFLKYENFIGNGIRVRNSDFSVSGSANLSAVNGNTITVDSALGFVPVAGYVFEFDDYTTQSEDAKLSYGSMSDTAFPDGGIQYTML